MNDRTLYQYERDTCEKARIVASRYHGDTATIVTHLIASEEMFLSEQIESIGVAEPLAVPIDNMLADALSWRIRKAICECYAADHIAPHEVADLLTLFPDFDPKASDAVDMLDKAAREAPGPLRFSAADFIAAVDRLKEAAR